jgi:hypothetical protein
MTDSQDDHEDPDRHHVETRADLLPEEKVAGSDDPEAQAAAILKESEERTQDPEGTREESEQTPDDPVAEKDLGPA